MAYVSYMLVRAGSSEDGESGGGGVRYSIARWLRMAVGWPLICTREGVKEVWVTREVSSLLVPCRIRVDPG